MVNQDGKEFGEQFDADRFEMGQKAEDIVRTCISEIFDARNVVAVEPDEAYDNFTDNKEIHQVMDYTGIDYLVDTFNDPLFGVNHRNHFNEKASRFDIRSETGSRSPSELDKVQKAVVGDIVPRYATRLKIPDDEPKWFRVVDMQAFVDALNSGLTSNMQWSDGSGVRALMYDYDELTDAGAIVTDLRFETVDDV